MRNRALIRWIAAQRSAAPLIAAPLIAASLIAVAVLVGCNRVPDQVCPISFQLDRRQDIRTESPSRVIMEFTLRTCRGDPVPGLDASAFSFYEDGALISAYESARDVQNPVRAYEFESLLLLDMSGSTVRSDDLQALLSAAQGFVEEFAPGQQMAVYIFDGRSEIIQKVDFTDDVDELVRGIQELADHQIVDESTNLYGAIARGLDVLDERRQGATSLYSSSLTVFTDGTHRAGASRRTLRQWFASFSNPAAPDGPLYPGQREVIRKVRSSPHTVYAIGMGGEIDEDILGKLGKDGFFSVGSVAELPNAFDRLIDFSQSTYVVTYCSPARTGKHRLRVQVQYDDMQGIYIHRFDAEGFTGGCTAP